MKTFVIPIFSKFLCPSAKKFALRAILLFNWEAMSEDLFFNFFIPNSEDRVSNGSEYTRNYY